jgi:hypothetical protein
LPRDDPPPETQIARIAEDDGDLRAGSGVEAVGGLPLGEGVLRLVGIDGGVISLRLGGRRGLQRTVRLHLRIGKLQESVRLAWHDGRIGPRVNVTGAASAAARGEHQCRSRRENPSNRPRERHD